MKKYFDISNREVKLDDVILHPNGDTGEVIQTPKDKDSLSVKYEKHVANLEIQFNLIGMAISMTLNEYLEKVRKYKNISGTRLYSIIIAERFYNTLERIVPETNRVYLSDHNIPLVYIGEPNKEKNILTVENYTKWYKLFEIDNLGRVEAVEIDYDKYHNISLNHVFNPLVLIQFAKDNNYELCEQSFEMIVGRWVLEKDGEFTINSDDLDYFV